MLAAIVAGAALRAYSLSSAACGGVHYFSRVAGRLPNSNRVRTASVMGSFCSTPAKPAGAEEVVEATVCNVSDLPEGAPKQFKVDNKNVLVVKHRGEVHAVSDRCTHYGASLCNGDFRDGVVRCPFHGACFSVETGDIEDYPGLDSLQKFEVDVADDSGEVRVRARKSQLENLKRQRVMAKRDPANEQTIVIVGGGPAAEVCYLYTV